MISDRAQGEYPWLVQTGPSHAVAWLREMGKNGRIVPGTMPNVAGNEDIVVGERMLTQRYAPPRR